LAGSEYLKEVLGLTAGRPTIDLDREVRVQKAALAAMAEGIVSAAHDCSEGGLAVALAEMCIAANKGIDASDAYISGRLDAALFGEAQSRILLALRPEAGPRLAPLAQRLGLPLAWLGRFSGDRFRLGPYIDLPLAQLRAAYEGGLERALGG